MKWNLLYQDEWAALPTTGLTSYTGRKCSYVFRAGGDRSTKGEGIVWKRNEEPREKAVLFRESLETQDASVRWGGNGEEKDEGCSEWFRIAGMTSHLALPRTRDVRDNPCQTRAADHPTALHPQLC